MNLDIDVGLSIYTYVYLCDMYSFNMDNGSTTSDLDIIIV